VLRAKIFDGLAALFFESHRADDEFIFRRDRHFEVLPIAGHIKNGGADHRRLSDHANVPRTRGQQERFDLVILLNDAAVFRTGRSFQFDSRVHGSYSAGEGVVALQQFVLCRILSHRPGRW
jgi:hypothetical protein